MENSDGRWSGLQDVQDRENGHPQDENHPGQGAFFQMLRDAREGKPLLLPMDCQEVRCQEQNEDRRSLLENEPGHGHTSPASFGRPTRYGEEKPENGDPEDAVYTKPVGSFHGSDGYHGSGISSRSGSPFRCLGRRPAALRDEVGSEFFFDTTGT